MDSPSTSSQGTPRSDIGDVENEPIVDVDMGNADPAMPGDGAEGDKDEQEAEKNSSGPTERKPDNGNERENVAEPINSRKAQKKEQKMRVEAYMRREMVGNNYPKHAMTPVPRAFLKLTVLEMIQNGRHSKGEFVPDANKKCIICHQAEDPTGVTELIDCHGTMNGEMKGAERIFYLNNLIREKHEKSMAEWEKEEATDEKKSAPPLRLIPEGQHACRSKFHMSCIMKYNAGDFHFQYAARVECQAKFLCPLHCCYRCDVNHQKQSAYVSDLVECALCLRAFHTVCYPAGARDQYVTVDTAQGERQFEMIICPNHPEELPATTSKTTGKNGVSTPKANRAADGMDIKKHLNGCLYDHCEFFKKMEEEGLKIEEMPPLIECTTCVRSFHRECCEVQTIDGVPISENQCEICACKDIVPIGMTVLAAWESKGFFLAKTVGWYDYPTNDRARQKNFERSGYTVVEWKDGSSSGKQLSIVPVCQMAELIRNYVRTASKSVRSKWSQAFTERDEQGFSFAPPVKKLVYQTAKTSKHFGSCRPRLQHHDQACRCEVKDGRKCFDYDCEAVQVDMECPPGCGKACLNRKIRTGFVNEQLVLKDTHRYGYGVVAKGVIGPSEFLCEYAGEIINDKEKKRRLDAIKISRDFQCNNYLMELNSGLCVDATRYGNIARYINHSCEPNAECCTYLVFNRRDKDGAWYEPRAYLKTLRTIAPGEEITFSYEMGDNENLPHCQCGTRSCSGYMTKTSQTTVTPKMKNSKGKGGKNVVKKEATKKNGEASKDARPTKKRDASQTASPTPSKRSKGTRTPVPTKSQTASTSATPAPKDSPLISPRRINRPSDVPSTSSTAIPYSPSVTVAHLSIQSRAPVSVRVQVPVASPATPRRSSPRGRSVQVPVEAPVLPDSPVQAPVQNDQDPVQEDAGRSPRRRIRAPKKRFQVEGF